MCVDVARTYSFEHANSTDRTMMLGLMAFFVLRDTRPSYTCSIRAANACCTADEGRAPSTSFPPRPSTSETTLPMPAMPHAKAMKRPVAQLGRLYLEIPHLNPERAQWRKVFQAWHHTKTSSFHKAAGGALLPVRGSSGCFNSGKGSMVAGKRAQDLYFPANLRSPKSSFTFPFPKRQ